MSWNFTRFHKILNQTDAKTFSFLSWQKKSFIPKKNDTIIHREGSHSKLYNQKIYITLTSSKWPKKDLTFYDKFLTSPLKFSSHSLYNTLIKDVSINQGLLYRWTEHSILSMTTGGGKKCLMILHKLTQSL